jgi:hypothetical protein
VSDEPTPVVAIEVGAYLKGLAGDSDGLLTSERKSHCYHHFQGGIVDAGARTLRCGGCGAPMDPYDYLAFLARDGDTLVRARKQIRELNDKLGDLQKLERNARARVKRWQAKAKAQE